MLEKDVEKYLVERAKALGGEVRKVRWVNRNGAPDRLVMLPLRHDIRRTASGQEHRIVKAPLTLWIELKRPGVLCEGHQVREHVRLRKMGQRVEVVDSFERVDEVLR